MRKLHTLKVRCLRHIKHHKLNVSFSEAALHEYDTSSRNSDYTMTVLQRLRGPLAMSQCIFALINYVY